MESVLRRLNAASTSLDALLTALNVYSRADTSLRAIASAVIEAATSAPDIALAAIVLNQVGGRYAIRHCIDSAVLACLVARHVGRSDAEVLTIAAAALTMNVGMLRDSDAYQARATLLDAAERDKIRRHPVDGAELLRCAGVDDKDWIACVLQHHEAPDGSGYPHGLARPDIADDALLVGMADRYCACIGARNYRRSMLAPDALAVLIKDNADHPQLVRAFVDVLGAMPPGTLVRLADGGVGVVSARQPDGPLVRVLRGADGSGHEQTLTAPAIDCALHEADARLRFSMTAVWGAQAAL